jgi:hypothetical protein
LPNCGELYNIGTVGKMYHEAMTGAIMSGKVTHR